jgi:hypothetical protein
VPDAVCISAQTVTSPRPSIHMRLSNCGDNHMLFIVGVGIVLIAVGIISWMRVLGGVNSATLRWMSEQSFAEHRASHSL